VSAPDAQARPRAAAAAGRSSLEALPNLIVIGAQKCGTSSLHRYLDAHPGIAMSRAKELDFFLDDGSWSRGLEWYASQFDGRASVRGESSPNYTNLPVSAGVAERIAEVLPDARLLYMVRDPIDRALSHYVHARGLGREDRSVGEALAEPDSRYMRRSQYRRQLAPFVARTPPERVLVVAQEDLRDRRRQTLREVFEFLGVDSSFDSDAFEREWEVSAGKDRKFKLAYRFSRVLGGKQFWGRVPPGLRWGLERLALGRAGRPVAAPEIDPELRARLVRELEPEVRWLREYAGQSFAGWSV